MFRAIGADKFPPFGRFRLEIPPVDAPSPDLAEIHLLTGVNGTGKTRILAALSAMLANGEPLKRRLKGVEEPIQFAATDVIPAPDNHLHWPNQLHASAKQANWVQGGPLYEWAGRVPAFAYSGIAYVTDAPITVMADVPKPDRAACLAFVRPENQSAALLQAIANLKVQAAMDWMNQTADAGGTRATRIVAALESTITRITGLHFSFIVTSYPKAALEVSWGGVKLSFDTLPDGLRSIIGWLAHSVVMMDAWLQGTQDPLQTEAVFLLDEIEGALHPAWQRRILPAFQRLFPKSQMFVATHSPFLIASLNQGWVHPITLSGEGKASVLEPIAACEGDSYVSVVEDIMGVREWYDPDTEALLAQFRAQRDAAFGGDLEARDAARTLAAEIANRSMELEYMMGRELRQMDRQLSKRAAPR